MSARVLAGLVSSLLLVAGCSASSGPKSVALMPVAATSSRTATAKPKEFVVWSHTAAPDAPSWVTRVVTVDSGGITEREETAAAVMVHDRHAYRFEVTTIETALYSCEPSPAGEPVALDEKTELHVGWILDEATGRSSRVIDAGDVSTMNQLDDAVSLVATVGPFVFVESSFWGYSCGPHGNSSRSALVYDIRTGKPADVFSPTEHADVDRLERNEAREALDAQSQGIFDAGPVDLDAVDLVASTPHFDHGKLGIDLTFVTATCNLCGDAEWGSYSRSSTVEAHAIPASLRAYGKPQPWLGTYAARHPTESIGGVSEIDDVALVAGLAEALSDGSGARVPTRR